MFSVVIFFFFLVTYITSILSDRCMLKCLATAGPVLHTMYCFNILCFFSIFNTSKDEEEMFGSGSSYSPLILAFCGSDFLLMLTRLEFLPGHEQCKKINTCRIRGEKLLSGVATIECIMYVRTVEPQYNEHFGTGLCCEVFVIMKPIGNYIM